MNRVFTLFLLILSFPFWMVIAILIKASSKGPVLFGQKRAGKDKKIFTIYKFRTMLENAESLKKKYFHLNEADGPVFKIRNDPRYTKVGKWLSHTGLDELPQIINIIKGEMAFVGPRPLPIDEASKVPKKYEKRFSILPGITSLWVIQGSHALSFDDWMRLDIDYVLKRSVVFDSIIAFLTLLLIMKSVARKMFPTD